MASKGGNWKGGRFIPASGSARAGGGGGSGGSKGGAVTKADIAKSSMVQRLLAIGNKQAPKRAPSQKSLRGDETKVMSALRAEMSRRPTGDVATTESVRSRVNMSKERFDSAALRLQSSGKIALHHHDAAAWLTPQKRAGLVADTRGNHYIGIVPR